MLTRKCGAGAWLLPLVFLVGCAMQAAKPNMVGLARESAAVEQVHIDPFRLLGVVETEAIKNGEYRAFDAKLPFDLAVEFQQYRVSWIGRAVDADGRIYPIQFVWTGCHSSGIGLRLTAIVEGLDKTAGVKAVLLSTLVDGAYTLDHGQKIESSEARQFQSDVAYQREFIRANGTSLETLPAVSGVRQMLGAFRHYGTLLVPPNTPDKVVRAMMEFNPAETIPQKYTRVASTTLVPSIEGMMISSAIDGLMTIASSCRGWHTGCAGTADYYFAVSQQCAARRNK